MPGLTARLAGATGVLTGIGSLIAAIPSTLILLGVVPIPAGMRSLAAYVTSAVTVVLVLAVILLTPAITRVSKSATALVILMFAAVGALAATGYFSYVSDHVVQVPDSETEPLLIPAAPSQELRDLLEPYNFDYSEALATSIQRERIVQLMNREDWSTIAILLALLVSTQVFMVIAILLGVWKAVAG